MFFIPVTKRGISRAEFGEWSQRNCARATSAWNQAAWETGFTSLGAGKTMPFRNAIFTTNMTGNGKHTYHLLCHLETTDWEWFNLDLPPISGELGMVCLWHGFTIVLPLIADVRVVYIPTNRLVIVDFFRKKKLFPLRWNQPPGWIKQKSERERDLAMENLWKSLCF